MFTNVRSHLTYANVMASIAVFVALGGTSAAAVALKKNSVGTKQLKKNAVTSTKVKNGSLAAGDFKAGQLKRGPAGPQGATGQPGPKGDPGTAAFRGWARITNNEAVASVVASSGGVTANDGQRQGRRHGARNENGCVCGGGDDRRHARRLRAPERHR